MSKNKDDKQTKKKMNKNTILVTICLIIFFGFLIFNFINYHYLNNSIEKNSRYDDFVKDLEEDYETQVELVETLKNDDSFELGVFETTYENEKYLFYGELLTSNNNNLHYILTSRLVLKEDIERLFKNSLSYTIVYKDDKIFGEQKDTTKKYPLSIYENYFDSIDLNKKKGDYVLINIASTEKLTDEDLKQKVEELKTKYNQSFVMNYYYTSNQDVVNNYEKDLLLPKGVSLVTFDRNNFEKVTRITYKNEELLLEKIKE